MESLLVAVLSSVGFQLVIAGGMGGGARWLYSILVDQKLRPGQGLATVLLGCILGYYVSPNLIGMVGAALSAFSTDPEKLPVLSAFVTGGAGVSLLGFAFDWLNSRRKQLNTSGGVAPGEGVAAPKPDGGKP